MLSIDANKRPTLKELCSDRWLFNQRMAGGTGSVSIAAKEILAGNLNLLDSAGTNEALHKKAIDKLVSFYKCF